MIIFKNLFSFALTFKAYEWLITHGGQAGPVFNALGAVQVIVCVLSVPMCKYRLSDTFPSSLFADLSPDIYGKRNRSFFYRHDILAKVGLR